MNQEFIEKDKHEYPDETGYYIARFPSGAIRVAFFTRLIERTKNNPAYGRWGDRNPMDGNYTPLKDPCSWQKIEKQNLGEKHDS